MNEGNKVLNALVKKKKLYMMIRMLLVLQAKTRRDIGSNNDIEKMVRETTILVIQSNSSNTYE